MGQSLDQLVPELVVYELFRRARISSGRAAELLGVPRVVFIERATALGIPYFDLSEQEFAAEREAAERILR